MSTSAKPDAIEQHLREQGLLNDMREVDPQNMFLQVLPHWMVQWVDQQGRMTGLHVAPDDVEPITRTLIRNGIKEIDLKREDSSDYRNPIAQSSG